MSFNRFNSQIRRSSPLPFTCQTQYHVALITLHNFLRRPKACLGTLFLSSKRYDSGKSPVCVGFAKRLHPSDEPSQLASESIPGGEFKYACVGYAAWDDEELKRAARRRTSPTDAVQLPYCEGLEIVSSAAMHGRPDLLSVEGGNASRGAAPQSAEPSTTRGDQQRPGRSYSKFRTTTRNIITPFFSFYCY